MLSSRRIAISPRQFFRESPDRKMLRNDLQRIRAATKFVDIATDCSMTAYARKAGEGARKLGKYCSSDDFTSRWAPGIIPMRRRFAAQPVETSLEILTKTLTLDRI